MLSAAGRRAPGRETGYTARDVIGERYGNYQAISLLGEGGMGAVYLAEHPGIGRRVAIKVLRADMDHDPQLLTRFLNEARAANAIRHPNIIEVLDSGTTERGASYLVMELLEGEVLSSRIRRLVRLDERNAIEIAMQTALGLSAAHAKGIIHRDLKPDNLFLIPEPTDISRERVKILDFGIAKLHKMANDSLKTRTGTLMGTPVYMSPEQCLGTKEVDHRSDVYSLGCILFEMLASRPPFVSAGFGELLSMHLHEPPPSLRQFAPQVTPEIEQVVLLMLAKRPEARCQSMTEVHRLLAAAAQLPNAISPEHKLGNTNPLGGTAVMEPPAGTRSAPPSTLTPGDMVRGGIVGTTVKVRVRPWLAMGIGALVIAAAGVAAVVQRSPAAPPPVVTRPAPPEPEPAPAPQPLAMVRVHLESTPAGARVVRVSDGVVLGTTPETIEQGPAAEPLHLRLEKDGFVSATREVSLTADSYLSVVLEAAALERVPAAKKHTPTKTRPEHYEPAKL
jgi:serine/threonine-protein kinase